MTEGESDEPLSLPSGSTRALVALLAFVLGFATIPHRVCERDATKWFEGDSAKTDALGSSVAAWTESEIAPSSYGTRSTRFDGEWHFVTYVMCALGFGQVALERDRDVMLAKMELCLDRMLDERLRAFDASAWKSDALDASGSQQGHVGFLGYAGLALALHRFQRPESRFAEREEWIMRTLDERLQASSLGILETYPGELYPVDNTAAYAALALHSYGRKEPRPKGLVRGLEALRSNGIDPATGLLFQAITADGKPRDSARASGTALAAYFLSYADAELSRTLFRSLERRQYRTVLGFGGMMEYPSGIRNPGDVDSGPVVLGFGVSASGFALGASRVHRDRDMFTALYATAHLFGAPLDENGTRAYVTGGPIGDAILFAMFTAPKAGRFAS